MNVMTNMRPVARATGATHPLADRELIADIEAVAAKQPAALRPAFDWLLGHARARRPLPTYGKKVNLYAITRDTGVGRGMVWRHRAVFEPFFARFEVERVVDAPRRDRLPGSEATGTDVPTPVLVKALEKAVDEQPDEDTRRFLSQLVQIAGDDRLLPMMRGRASTRQVAVDAGVADPTKWLRDNPRIMMDWVAFFDLSDHQRGTSRPQGYGRRTAAAAVARHLASLPKGEKLRHQPGFPDRPSYAYLADLLTLHVDNVKKGRAKRLIDAYFAKFGPGDPAEPRSRAELRARRERRNGIVRFAAQMVAAGMALPSMRRNPGRSTWRNWSDCREGAASPSTIHTSS